MWWFTADTHFGHRNILEYCDRPFKSLRHMDMELIRRWNERVRPQDTVFHLGDVCFRRHPVPEFSELLPHFEDETPEEKTHSKMTGYQHYVKQLNGSIIVIRGNHDARGDVRTLIESMVIRYGGYDIWLSHEPEARYVLNFHGHIHRNWRIRTIKGKILVNVGVDVWNFQPVHITEIMKQLYAEHHLPRP